LRNILEKFAIQFRFMESRLATTGVTYILIDKNAFPLLLESRGGLLSARGDTGVTQDDGQVALANLQNHDPVWPGGCMQHETTHVS
jgi:hypothetical protein